MLYWIMKIEYLTKVLDYGQVESKVLDYGQVEYSDLFLKDSLFCSIDPLFALPLR